MAEDLAGGGYADFWPRVDAALASHPSPPTAMAFRPEKNYRDFSGPRHRAFPVRWSINFPREGMRVEANLATGNSEQTARAEEWLNDHLDYLAEAYAGDDELVAEARGTARGGRVVRLAAYRSGVVGESGPEPAAWFARTLIYLQSAFGTVLGAEPDLSLMAGRVPRPRTDKTVSPIPTRGYQRPYTPAYDRAERLSAAIAAARFAVTHPDLHVAMRKRVLVQATWEATEVDGKLTPRYRSPAAMQYNGPKYHAQLRHDHVHTRALLIEQMLTHPEQLEDIMRRAVACLVTAEEHTRLGIFDTSHTGWERYLAARVDVLDASTGDYVIRDGVALAQLP